MGKKVAFFCTSDTRPRTLNMARILAKAGFRVTVIEWDRTGEKAKMEEKEGIKFKRLKLKAGYGLAIFPLFPFWAFFIFVETVYGHYSILQPQNLDCLIPTFIAALSLKPFRGTKIVYDLADFYADAYVPRIRVLSWVSSFLERLLVRCLDATILVSERQVLQVGPRNLSKKVIVFYNFPSVNHLRTYIDHDEKSKKLLLLYAGTFGPDRVTPLINVAKAIRNLPVKFLIAGFGEFEDLVVQLCETHREIVFLGKLNHEKVMEFTEEADVILLPYESINMNCRIALACKFFEAIAVGKLMLAPYDTYMGDIVAKEEIGILVDYHDSKDIRAKIKSILYGDKEVIGSFSRNARRLYKKRFDSNKIAHRYLELVQSLV